jgi:hypothetical protein
MFNENRREYNRKVTEVVEASWGDEDDEDEDEDEDVDEGEGGGE